MVSIPIDPPLPLGPERLAAVPGVLGRIARERARAYAGTRVAAGVGRTAAARTGGRLVAALARPGLSLVAEVKRASPSEGAIAELDPVATALAYARGGAAAVSVLTEPNHFGGDLAHLGAVSAAVDVPAMRKDFVVHPAQLAEAAEHGAAAALLIVAVLGDELGAYLGFARALGLDALVEVHDEDELALALAAGADVIGVNNRDLRSLAVDRTTAPRLIGAGRAARTGALWVAESGYATPADLEGLQGLADAVLVGTALMRGGDPAAALRALLAST